MKAIAQTLGISRSNMIRRVNGEGRSRQAYRKSGDQALLDQIRVLVDQRPTYGYRRIGALLNKMRERLGQAAVNHKCVYRLMKQNSLLLARHTGKQRMERSHEGKVITLRSNLRWSSDGFEIPCWNGEVVRVSFAIDTCDREIMAWEAGTGGYTGESIRNLMYLCVDRRFGADFVPHAVEWLTDNGSAYTAHETIAFARSLGLVPCFTPVRSPESNGMAESFVKTFKRDYVYINDRPDALTVLGRLDDWFEDYNENHPHKGLRLKSPREFIRTQKVASCPV